MVAPPYGHRGSRFPPLSQNLKDVLANMIPKEQAKIKNFRQQHGSTAIGQITVDMVSGGGGRVLLQRGCATGVTPSLRPSPGVRRDEGHEGADLRDLRAGSR